MKRFPFVLSCMILIFCCLTNAQAADRKIVTVIVESANLREGPSIDSKAVKATSRGSVLEVLDEFTGPAGAKWYRLKTPDNKPLWIAGRVVSLGNTQPAGPQKAETGIQKSGPDKADEKMLQDLLDAGNSFFREGKCEEFIKAYQKAILIVEKQKDLAAEGKLHYNISECYSRLKKYPESIKHLDVAIVLAEKTDNSELELLALIDKSRVSVISGDKTKALEILKFASEKANRYMFLNISPDDNLKALISFQMAVVLFQLDEKEKAKGKLAYALTLNSDFKMEEDIINLIKTVDIPTDGQISSVNKMLDEAWGLYEKGDYKGMEKGSMDALDIAKRLGYKKGVFGGNYYIAMASVSMGKYDNAIDHALHAQELAEKGLDKMRLGMVYNLTGNIFKEKKAFDKALHYYGRNLDIMRTANDTDGQAVALNNIGNALMDKGEYRDALKYYEDSLQTGIDIKTSGHFIAQGYLSLGRAKNKTGDYSGAEKSIIKAMSIFRGLQNAGGEIVCLWEMAANYAAQGEYKVAVKTLEDNLDYAEKFGMKQNFIDDIVVYSEKSKDYLRAEKYRKRNNENK